MTKKRKVNIALTITSIVLSILALIGVVVGIHNDRTTEKVVATDYSIGAINETGKIIESKQSAYLKDMHSTDGLKIELEEETATITYKVVFYNEDGEYISTTDALESDFDAETIPETATQFRVVVTPYAVDGEPVELSIFNVSKYTSQLEISYNV